MWIHSQIMNKFIKTKFIEMFKKCIQMSQKTEVSAYLWLFPTRTSLRLVTWKKKISHMLYQLYCLLISFNLHNSFMKYLLFLLYDICKIGLANWSWPKVKGKVSGGTRTKRRTPRCWAHYIWAEYSLLFLVPGFLSTFHPWSVCLRLILATSISRSFLPMDSSGCSQTNEIRRERGGMWMKKFACHISKQSMLCHLATSHYRP